MELIIFFKCASPNLEQGRKKTENSETLQFTIQLICTIKTIKNWKQHLKRIFPRTRKKSTGSDDEKNRAVYMTETN